MPAHNLHSRRLPATCTTDHPTLPSRLLAHMSRLLLCIPFLLGAGGVGVQPAAEPRHVQRHRHAVDVSGALPCVPCPQPPQSGPPCCLRHRPPHPTLPPACPHAAPPPMLSLFTRQRASAFNQPLSLDTSSVTAMGWMFSVRSARALPSAPTVGAFPTPCMRCRRRPLALPARLLPLLLCFLFYSAGRVNVQPAAEPRHV